MSTLPADKNDTEVSIYLFSQTTDTKNEYSSNLFSEASVDKDDRFLLRIQCNNDMVEVIELLNIITLSIHKRFINDDISTQEMELLRKLDLHREFYFFLEKTYEIPNELPTPQNMHCITSPSMLIDLSRLKNNIGVDKPSLNLVFRPKISPMTIEDMRILWTSVDLVEQLQQSLVKWDDHNYSALYQDKDKDFQLLKLQEDKRKSDNIIPPQDTTAAPMDAKDKLPTVDTPLTELSNSSHSDNKKRVNNSNHHSSDASIVVHPENKKKRLNNNNKIDSKSLPLQQQREHHKQDNNTIKIADDIVTLAVAAKTVILKREDESMTGTEEEEEVEMSSTVIDTVTVTEMEDMLISANVNVTEEADISVATVTMAVTDEADLPVTANVTVDVTEKTDVPTTAIVTSTADNNYPFTKEQDSLLRAGYRIYNTASVTRGPDWEKIAAHISPDITAAQCMRRAMALYLSGAGTTRSGPPWSAEEDALLLESIAFHKAKAMETKQKNIWNQIGKDLNRPELECSSRYRSLKNAALKKGPFTTEEDEIILAMRSTGGTFEGIGRAIGRPGKRCSERYTKLQSAKSSICNRRVRDSTTPTRGKKIFGSEEDDRLLIEAYEKYGTNKGTNQHQHQHQHPDWSAIAEYVGGGFSRQQCLRRWAGFLDPALADLRRDEWTTEEDTSLLEIIEKHRTPKEQGGKVLWGPVRRDMRRSEQDCRNRYRELLDLSKRRGQFTDEEDQTILRLRSSQISWTDIGDALGRSGKRCSERHRKLMADRMRATTTTSDTSTTTNTNITTSATTSISDNFTTNNNDDAVDDFKDNKEKEMKKRRKRKSNAISNSNSTTTFENNLSTRNSTQSTPFTRLETVVDSTSALTNKLLEVMNQPPLHSSSSMLEDPRERDMEAEDAAEILSDVDNDTSIDNLNHNHNNNNNIVNNGRVEPDTVEKMLAANVHVYEEV